MIQVMLLTLETERGASVGIHARNLFIICYFIGF